MICLFFSVNQRIAVRILATCAFYLFADAWVSLIFPLFCEGQISSAQAVTLKSEHIFHYRYLCLPSDFGIVYFNHKMFWNLPHFFLLTKYYINSNEIKGINVFSVTGIPVLPWYSGILLSRVSM